MDFTQRIQQIWKEDHYSHDVMREVEYSALT